MRFRLFYRKPRKKKRKNKGFFLLPLIVLFMIFVGIFFIIRLDRTIFPIALQAAELHAMAHMNEIVNSSTMGAIERHSLISQDFYSISTNYDGKLNSLSVNTVLINHLSNEIAVSMSRELIELDNERIQIPYGALTGIRVIANLGPMYTVYLMPIGEVLVDYSSSFASVGINQVNFQVWLNINARINIVNPLQSSEILLERRVPLVNTVINAEIPNVYFNNSADGIIISTPN
ncbi:MAG: sporulation protein YunB [Defluviitaleaceae bacterium]|nr:sporulation protein YunB [Defluviitaleaceae bacterium]